MLERNQTLRIAGITLTMLALSAQGTNNTPCLPWWENLAIALGCACLWVGSARRTGSPTTAK